MKTYNVEVTETITNTYCLTLQATDKAAAEAAALIFAEQAETPDDYSVGYDVWYVNESDEQDEEL
jgi:hypothetical protein